MSSGRLIRSSGCIAAIAGVAAGAVYLFDRYTRPNPRPAPKLVGSLDYSIRMSLNESQALDKRFAASTSADWRQLDDAERNWLVDEIIREQDIFTEWKGMVLTDVWGTPVRIEVRRPPSGIEFRTSSAGADRTFGTLDDIVYRTSDPSPNPPYDGQ